MSSICQIESFVFAFTDALQDVVISILSSRLSISPSMFCKISAMMSLGLAFDNNCGILRKINSVSLRNSIPYPNFSQFSIFSLTSSGYVEETEITSDTKSIWEIIFVSDFNFS